MNIKKAVYEGGKWNVQYFFAADGTRFCMKVLDDRQAQEEKLAAWRETKYMKDGFRQANPWKA